MIDILKLQIKNRLTLDDTKTLVALLPMDEYSYTTYPLNAEDLNECIFVSIEDYIGLSSGIKKFTPDLTTVIDISEEELLLDNQELDEAFEEMINQSNT